MRGFEFKYSKNIIFSAKVRIITDSNSYKLMPSRAHSTSEHKTNCCNEKKNKYLQKYSFSLPDTPFYPYNNRRIYIDLTINLNERETKKLCYSTSTNQPDFIKPAEDRYPNKSICIKCKKHQSPKKNLDHLQHTLILRSLALL